MIRGADTNFGRLSVVFGSGAATCPILSSYPNGTTATYSYWPSNRVETITHQAGETVISRFAYTYDANGNRTQQVEVQGAVSEATDYGYDDLDRLEDFTVTTDGNVTVTAYTFEGYNRKTEDVSVNAVPTVAKTYDYDESNWLSGVTDNVDPANPRTIGYQYDANGNTLEKSSNCGPTTSFVFDSRNQLVETTQGATLLGRYDYDAQGLRIRHRGSERGDVDYFYDDGAVLEERLASGSLLAHYRYADRLLSLNAPSDGGVQYYHHDALGSTVNLTDSVGGTKVSYTLDPWGHIRNQIGSSVNRMVFTGQETDEQTGLIYFGARYYDPDSARFLTQDSYLGEPGTPPSLHRYLYAYANPTVYIDLAGYMSATTEIDQAATRAAEEGNNLKLAGLVTAQAGYKLADVLTFGWISKHDESRDKYDRGEISLQEYAGDSLKAAGESGVYLGATIATGGVAGYATRGMSLTTQLVAAGAASGVGYQAADDALKGEISGVGTYAGAAGVGAAGGLAARGAIGMKNVLGEASIKEGMQILKAAAKDNAQAAARMTGEVANGAQEAGQKLMQKVKTAYQSSTLADETGAIVLRSGNASKAEAFTTYYHATSADGAASIRSSGIDLAYSRAKTDFGKGFYVTTDQAQANAWAKARFRESGEVLEFKVPQKSLGELNVLDMNSKTNSSLGRFIKHNRLGGKMHSHDVVEGSMLGNPSQFLRGSSPRFFGQQTSFHTKDSLDVLYGGLQ